MKAKTNYFFISILFIFCFGSFVNGQNTDEDPHAYHNSLMKELKGVYQVQLDNPRSQPMISTELLELVKDNQKETSLNSFDYKSMKIVVKSRQDVENGILFDESEFVVKRN